MAGRTYSAGTDAVATAALGAAPTAMSFYVWVQAPTATGTAAKMLLSLGDQARLSLNAEKYGGGTPTAGSLYFGRSWGTTDHVAQVHAPGATWANLNHVGVSYDGSSTANVATIYLNGVALVNDETRTAGGAIDATSAAFIVGNDVAKTISALGTYGFAGFHNVALTDAEMAAAYRYGFHPRGLVVAQPLGLASPETDWSGGGNTGTVTGASVASVAFPVIRYAANPSGSVRRAPRPPRRGRARYSAAPLGASAVLSPPTGLTFADTHDLSADLTFTTTSAAYVVCVAPGAGLAAPATPGDAGWTIVASASATPGAVAVTIPLELNDITYTAAAFGADGLGGVSASAATVDVHGLHPGLVLETRATSAFLQSTSNIDGLHFALELNAEPEWAEGQADVRIESDLAADVFRVYDSLPDAEQDVSGAAFPSSGLPGPVTTPSTTTDDFATAATPPIGWVQVDPYGAGLGPVKADGGVLTAVSAASVAAYRSAVLPADQEVYLTWTTLAASAADRDLSCYLRVANPGVGSSGYSLDLTTDGAGTTTWSIAYQDGAGGYTVIASATHSVSTGCQVRFSCIGTTLGAYFRASSSDPWTLVVEVTDGSHPGGGVQGVYLRGADNAIDDWTATGYTTSPGSLGKVVVVRFARLYGKRYARVYQS